MAVIAETIPNGISMGGSTSCTLSAVVTEDRFWSVVFGVDSVTRTVSPPFPLSCGRNGRAICGIIKAPTPKPK